MRDTISNRILINDFAQLCLFVYEHLRSYLTNLNETFCVGKLIGYKNLKTGISYVQSSYSKKKTIKCCLGKACVEGSFAFRY